MRWLVVVALCACNQIYGLDVTIRDADPFFDAPPHDPYVCPPAGTLLTFSPNVQQSQLDCKSYSESRVANRAVMLCRVADVYQLFSGPIDNPLVAIKDVEIPQSTDSLRVEDVLLSADGELAVVARHDYNTDVQTQEVYRFANARWNFVEKIPNPPFSFSTVTYGPVHRTIAGTGNADPIEYTDASGSLRPSRTHRRTTLQVSSAESIWLSADGLRIVFLADTMGTGSARYMAQSERAALDDEFGPVTKLTIPVVTDAFVTEDCGRLYFSGLRILFYVEQAQ